MPAASNPLPSPDCNHAPPKRIASTTIPYFKGFRFLYRHSRHHLGGPWVGPIHAARKRLNLTTVTPGATSTLSSSSASPVLFRCLDVFSSSFIHHAAIDLQPPFFADRKPETLRVRSSCRCYAFECMVVAIRGRYRMARDWPHTKLSLSSALLPSFSGMGLVLLFLSFCCFLFCFCFVFHALV